MEYVLKKQKK